jgi:outer membrane protein OmpA-like peptidoglycan-associated protein
MKTNLFIISMGITYILCGQKINDALDFNSKNYTITNATMINSPDLDFFPCFYEKDVLFVSSRDKQKSIDKTVSEHFFSPFISSFNDKNELSSAKKFELNILGRTHFGPFSYNENTKKMYFSLNNMKKNKPLKNEKNEVTLKIYEATVSGKDWISIKDLPFNNDNYSCTHPCIDQTNTILVFASNMPGGYGGFDLYFSKFEKNKWSIPVNLGKNINTTGNEIFPFLSTNNTLYFSSNKHNSIGGYDIFSTDFNASELNYSINIIDSPLNSEYDDLCFVMRNDNKVALFSSTRPEGVGKDDIYLIKMNPKFNEENNIIIRDRNSNQAVANANIRIYKFDGNNFFNKKGKSLYDIVINNQSEGGMNMNFALKTSDFGDPDDRTDIGGTSKYIFENGKKYVIYILQEEYEPRVFNYSTIGKKNEIAVILLDKKSDGNILKSKIIADNFNSSIEGCTIKLKNLNTNESNSTTTDYNGRFSFSIKKSDVYEIKISKDGYTDFSKKLNNAGDLNSIITLKAKSSTPIKGKLEKGTLFVLNNINYDFGKAIIKPGAAKELDALTKIMKENTSIEIELKSHTDSRGSKEFNKELSLKRAEEAKKYLVEKGIADNRITTLGFGESDLRNNCKDGVDCSEKEHLYNRRTEITITKIENPFDIIYTSNGLEIAK